MNINHFIFLNMKTGLIKRGFNNCQMAGGSILNAKYDNVI